MSKFYCKECNTYFEMNYFKWIFKTLFHMFGKRLTRCPNCGKKFWAKPLKDKT